MTVEELREARKTLEAGIMHLCEDFKTLTGLCVVDVTIEIGATYRTSSANRESFLLGVNVRTEQI